MSAVTRQDVQRFSARKIAEAAFARQTAAFFLATGIDLDRALDAPGEQKRRVVDKVERLIERERLKGLRGHWAYDLNRHIALKQARDLLDGKREQKATIVPTAKRKAAPEAPQFHSAKSHSGE